jgi:hypothetical protein
MKRRRNAPLTEAQVNALKGILSSHGAAAKPVTNPKRRSKKRRTGKKRRISASLRRKLLANLRKARKARWGRKSRR